MSSGPEQSYRVAVRSLLRERLLDAAAGVFSEDGWRRLTMAKVAERAGVSRQTVYNEFGSRDGVGGTRGSGGRRDPDRRRRPGAPAGRQRRGRARPDRPGRRRPDRPGRRRPDRPGRGHRDPGRRATGFRRGRETGRRPNRLLPALSPEPRP